MAEFLEEVIVQNREDGRLWAVLAVSEEGSVINLPARSVEYVSPANDYGHVSIKLSAHRVRQETLTDKEIGYGS